MTVRDADGATQVSATLVAFARGEAVAAPYDGWSKPPSADIVERAVRRGRPGGWATGQLIATVRSLVRSGGLDGDDLVAALAGADDASASASALGLREGGAQLTDPSRVGTDSATCASRAVAAGLWHRAPAAAAALGRSQASVTHDDEIAIDAAGVIAAATAVCLNAEWRDPAAGFLAEVVREHAQTPAVRRQLERVVRWDVVPPPPTAARELGNGADALPLVGPALLAASFRDVSVAIAWAARIGNHPSQVTAVGAALAAAWGPIAASGLGDVVSSYADLAALAVQLEDARPR